MLIQSRQQAWIHGLPGFEKPGGVPVEVVNFSPPKPDVHKLSFTLFASTSIMSTLRKLSTTQTKIPEFSLVVRTDPKNERDDQYQLADALIVSVQSSKELIGAETVIVSFERSLMIKGIQLN